jgi:hypothetical protein
MFVNAPLSTAITTPANTSAGTIVVDIYNTVTLENPYMNKKSTNNKVPDQYKFSPKAVAKKDYSVATALGEAELDSSYSSYSSSSSSSSSKEVLITYKKGTLQQSFTFVVKSPLAMLSRQLLQPCWTNWWRQEKEINGISLTPLTPRPFF